MSNEAYDHNKHNKYSVLFCAVYTNLPPSQIESSCWGTLNRDCALYNSNHTSSLFSSARKNLTSLKMSFFSWFEVDSRAMFKFLVSPPSCKLIWHLAQRLVTIGGKETCYQSPPRFVTENSWGDVLPLGILCNPWENPEAAVRGA